jgi:trans-aconitate 2-methyltransferase
MPWNPERYEQFKDARYAPFDDLTRLIAVRPHLNVIDLGCGTGELTRRLADMLPDSTTLGIDNSPEMLAKTAAFARPGVRFEQSTIEAVEGQYDLVFSHAAIQWVEDHHTLIPHLAAMVRPGGQIAVQLPSNHQHYTHVAIRELASEEPFRTALHGWTRQSPVLSIGDYAELLFDHGMENITVFEKIYPVRLENADGMADWTSGTTLVPFLERLPETLHAEFMAAYRARLHECWPGSPVFYAFQRTLFYATRPA